MTNKITDDVELFRPIFIENLKRFKDEQIIKILCGVRRCGKSTILKTYKKELLSLGVKSQNIIERLYSSMEFDSDFNSVQLYKDLSEAISDADKDQKIYLLLDEVQEVENWEKLSEELEQLL